MTNRMCMPTCHEQAPKEALIHKYAISVVTVSKTSLPSQAGTVPFHSPGPDTDPTQVLTVLPPTSPNPMLQE